jgi:phosphoglycolate phosphatase
MPEIIRPFRLQKSPRFAVIDFDGTLSLIRSGWVDIMVHMMIEVLRPLPGSKESDADLEAYISNFVLNLNGRPTIYQMDYFVNAAKERGGHPESPEFYTQRFLDALIHKADQRIESLKKGELTTDDLLVPGARALLTDLQSRGVQLTLASGTAVVNVKREAKLLEIDHFFEDRIYGPGEDSREFSKLAVMKQILAASKVDGAELLGLGDGFVEIENVKELGGIAIGCATDETHRSGQVEEWKRTRLIQAGADIIVPDYRNWHKLTDLLFPSND